MRKKETYSYSSLKLRTKRKLAIDLILVKRYKKDFAFLAAKTQKDITNHSPNLEKMLLQ